MNFRLIFVLLLITAALIGWTLSLWQEEKHSLATLIPREDSPEYVGRRMETLVYDQKGKLQYFAQAREIKRYQSRELTEFFDPQVELFDAETAQKQWKLTAYRAEINKEKILHLSGKVKLESLDSRSRLSVVETEQLWVNLATHDIHTDSQVKSRGMGFVTTGTGLVGNLKKQVATLTKDVKTYLEPTVINNAPEK